jgi:hypothetical protein
VLGLDSCVTKANLPAGRQDGKKGRGKNKKFFGFSSPLPAGRQVFPTFPFFLRQSQDKSLVLHFLVRRYLLSFREFPSATSGQALLKSYFLVFLLLLSSLLIFDLSIMFSLCMNDCYCFSLEFWVKPWKAQSRSFWN